MSKELQERIQWFRDEYLDTPSGQEHLATTEAEPKEVQEVFEDIRRKHDAGQDITDDVLRRLLPHTNSQFHRENGYRVSTWPCITKDVRPWFEGANWKKPEDWPETARLLFEAIDGLLSGNQEPWDRFLASEYRRGFAAGFVSPILFCLDPQYAVINSKVIKTYKYCANQLGQPDEIDARLDNYFKNAQKVHTLHKRLAALGLVTIQEFDTFCHFMVSKRLGGGNLTQDTEPEYHAWLFVANPEIFRWEQAFQEGGVEWTGSLGAYAQKLLRRQIRSGDRAFGYQAGPDYELCCELTVSSDPYKTADGTWATRLVPLRRLDNPIPLSVLKSHPVLSTLKFVQQTQISISGVTAEHLAALGALITEPATQAEVSDVARLRNDLKEAQFDTTHPDRFEALLAEAFALLGFETEHLGGPGKPDVIAVGTLGSDTYTAIIEAKTCQQHANLGAAGVNYGSISDHREEHTADYVLIIAPAFAGGKLVSHALRNNVGLLVFVN